jgi:two-component system, OmpR family, sensor histidine kinase KdpD
VTQSYVRDLEVVPRKTVEYHGSRFEEMDLAAVLARRPQVALVDELAHSNVPEPGGHGQRWQDVLAMVEAGIDVVSTVNIQHLASIAGTVERIANVPVRERVPDWVVRRADQIELVDSSPEQLRRRMLHGNIYPAGEVPGALAQFFSVGNLTALRELALRFLAAQTEEELLAYLRGLHGEASGETREHIMAAIAAVPGAAAVLRRAAALAEQAGADLDVVHVQGDGHADGHEVDRLRRVVSRAGGSLHLVVAEDPAGALIDFARGRRVTRIVVGPSQRSRWQELTGGGSVVLRLSRLAPRAGIDLHIVSLPGEDAAH